MRDPVETLRDELRNSMGAYKVKFTTIRPHIYEAEITMVPYCHEKPPMITPFKCGNAWKLPAASLLLRAITDDYLSVEVEEGTIQYLNSIGIEQELIPEMARLLEEQHEQVDRCFHPNFVEHVMAVWYEAGIDFIAIAPFLITESSLDGTLIPIEGEMR